MLSRANGRDNDSREFSLLMRHRFSLRSIVTSLFASIVRDGPCEILPSFVTEPVYLRRCGRYVIFLIKQKRLRVVSEVESVDGGLSWTNSRGIRFLPRGLDVSRTHAPFLADLLRHVRRESSPRMKRRGKRKDLTSRVPPVQFLNRRRQNKYRHILKSVSLSLIDAHHLLRPGNF